MRIFRFKSDICTVRDGYHYFGNTNIKKAKIMAKEFEMNNNKNNHSSYRIEFDMDDVVEINIICGYINSLSHPPNAFKR